MANIQRADEEGYWSRERLELVKRHVCPKGISDDELALFIEQCKRSGLDPLLKQAFCVTRRQNVGTKEHPQWVSRHEFEPAEAGMLARAERFGDYEGIQASAVREGDDVRIDAGHGEVQHSYCPTQRTGAIAGAWARVQRRAHVAVVVWLDFTGYAQASPLWQKIPATMIEKCARVAALRKAYPEAFGGLYIREEMPPSEASGGPALCTCEVDAPALPTLDGQDLPSDTALGLAYKDAGPPFMAGPADTTSPPPDAAEEAREGWVRYMLETIQQAGPAEMDALIQRVAGLPQGELRTRLGSAINARRRELRGQPPKGARA